MQPDNAESIATSGKLHLFSLYTDAEASAYAGWVTRAITKMAGPSWQSSSEMWKLELLTANEPIRQMITNHAVGADVIIIAISSLEQGDSDLKPWLDFLTTAPANHSTQGILIGLLGHEEDKSQEMSWLIKQLICCARKINRKFLWQWNGQSAVDDSGWLTEEVKMLFNYKDSHRQRIILREIAVALS